MSVKDFHKFLTSDEQLHSFGTCVQTVDILSLHGGTGGAVGNGDHRRLAKQYVQQRSALVVDGENCLDRLYGGYFSDWSCGGQWSHMVDFLATLLTTLQQSNVQLAIFLNGSLEADRFQDWRSSQMHLKDNVRKVLRHVHKRGTPPPKAWWVPPCAIQTLLRYALRTLNCSVLNSIDDHRQEVMSFCWENGYHGVMADDSEYAMFTPPRFFSAHALKMTFQYEVTTLEYVLDEMAKSLDLNPNRFCLLGALLGNHILPSKELKEFHQRLAPETKDPKYKVGFERVIRAVVNYIRSLPKIDDFERIGMDVFGSDKDPRIRKLKTSMNYYQSMSQEGYTKHKPKHTKKSKKHVPIKLASEIEQQDERNKKNSQNKDKDKKKNEQQQPPSQQHTDLVERIALEMGDLDINEAINAAAKVMEETSTSSKDEESVIQEDHPAKSVSASLASAKNSEPKSSNAEEDELDDDEPLEKEKKPLSVVQQLASGVDVAPSEEGKYPTKKSTPPPPPKSINIPDCHPEIHRTAIERHRQSQMSPYVHQLLTRGEIKLPVLLEDEKSGEIPLIHEMYQPLRRSVYAIIFNLHHQRYNRKQVEDLARANRRKADDCRKQAKKATSDSAKQELVAKAETFMKTAEEIKVPEKIEIRVREWLPYNNYEQPEVTEATELNWAVPTLQRLWFGSTIEDKQKRLRAFLSCMRSDDVPSLLTQASVPQHMLLLACVLRYIMSSPSVVILKKPELDAILATAFSPELRNPRYLAEVKVEKMTKRGVLLATMVMQGIEMALFANDACGAPVPFQMCLPWMFFDGKLFHLKLRKADSARNLMELCDGRMEVVYAIERIRAAILQGLMPQYSGVAMVGTPQVGGVSAAAVAASVNGMRNMQQQQQQQHQHQQQRGPPGMIARGGQLVVGGAVVGQWGANYGGVRQSQQQQQQQQQHQKKNKGQGNKNKKKNNKNKNGNKNKSKSANNKEEGSKDGGDTTNGTTEIEEQEQVSNGTEEVVTPKILLTKKDKKKTGKEKEASETPQKESAGQQQTVTSASDD